MENYEQVFVEAFVRRCFESGLTEKAASDLLEMQMVVATDVERPGFAEGWTKVAARFPGVLIPSPGPETFEKQAWAGTLAKGLGAVGLLGGIGYGAKKTYDHFDPNRLAENLPSAVGSNPRIADAEKNVTREYNRGVHDLNNEFYDERQRLHKLDLSVARMEPGSDAAMAEAARIRGNSNSATARRSAAQDQLDDVYNTNEDLLARAQARSAGREERSKAWYTAPYRWVNKTFLNRDPYLEARIRDQRAQSEIQKQIDRAASMRGGLLRRDTSFAPTIDDHRPRKRFEIEDT